MSPLVRTSPAGILCAALFPPKMKSPRWYIMYLLRWLQKRGQTSLYLKPRIHKFLSLHDKFYRVYVCRRLGRV
jgi:hypothetical protein